MADKPAPRRAAAGHRLAFIDALRAIAILLVFFRHSTEVFVAYGHGSTALFRVARVLNAGELGVVVFFAISGFLIPSSFHGSGWRGAGRYVISRVFRLYPAFLISILPSAASHFWINHAPYSAHQLILNLTMLPRLFGTVPANGAYWTLEVEIAFYLLCLLLFVGGVLRHAFVFAALALAAQLLFVSSQQLLFGGILNPPLLGTTFVFLIDLGVMFWAAVCRAWWDGRRLNPVTAAIFWGFAFLWVVLRPVQYVLALADGTAGGIDTNFLTGYSLALAIFLAVLVPGRLANPLLLWIGRISYSMYLFHGVVIHSVQWMLNNHIPLRALPADLDTAIALALSLLIAHLSYSLVERPFIRWGRMLAARWLGDPAQDAAVTTPVLPGWLGWLQARPDRSAQTVPAASDQRMSPS